MDADEIDSNIYNYIYIYIYILYIYTYERSVISSAIGVNSLSFQLKTGVWTAGLQDSWVELTARRAFRGLGKGPNYTVKNLLVRHARKVQEIGVFARTRSLWYTRSQSDNVHSDSDILSVFDGFISSGCTPSARGQYFVRWLCLLDPLVWHRPAKALRTWELGLEKTQLWIIAGSVSEPWNCLFQPVENRRNHLERHLNFMVKIMVCFIFP